MSYETVLYEVAEGVATISMNQPDSRNALSDDLTDPAKREFDSDVLSMRAQIDF